MKRLLYIFAAIGVAIASFLTGFLIRQPKMNKLKKQVETLQRDNHRLVTLCQTHKQKFQELLIQQKALKAFQFRKKATNKEQMAECLTMQYAIFEYVNVLMKRVKYNQELTKEEIRFFNAFEKAIDGKPLSASDKVIVTEFVKATHAVEIREMRECDYAEMMQELAAQPEQPKLIFCAVKLDPRKDPEYYLTEDSSIVVGDMIVVPAGRKKEAKAAVINIERCDEDTAPVPVKKAQHVIRKCSREKLELPVPKRGLFK